MNLRQLAESYLQYTLEDSVNGFGWPVKLVDPDDVEYTNLTAHTNDISQIVDPDTGTVVSGRQAAAIMRISSLEAAGAGEVKGVAENSRRPWRVIFDDINGFECVFKVAYADPDRTLGTVSLMLEAWKA